MHVFIGFDGCLLTKYLDGETESIDIYFLIKELNSFHKFEG